MNDFRMVSRLVLMVLLLVGVWAWGDESILLPLEPGTPVRGGAAGTDVQKFDFVVLGDRRGADDTEWPVFDRAIQEINLLDPDFVIMVGDMVQGGTAKESEFAAQWKDFWTHADALKPPLLMLPGNHDVSNPEMLKYWKQHVGRTYYSFDYRGCHFLVLNTQECRIENDGALGSEQAAFALGDLAKHADARHTFVLMHMPLWANGQPEWAKIEEALGARPYTVFAGHWHYLAYEVRHDRRYVVLGATKGVTVDEENRAPELGQFPFYTHVAVDGADVHLACIEPGNIWPADIAPRANGQALRNPVRVEAARMTGLDGLEIQAGIFVHLNNGLSIPVTVSLAIDGLRPDGWQLDGNPVTSVELDAGTERVVTLNFTVPTSALLPVPKLSCTVECRGKRIFKLEQNVPLFPESALRTAPEWKGVGPFAAGDLPKELPSNPREAMPGLFAMHGPDKGYQEGVTFDVGGKTLSWQLFRTQTEGGNTFVDLKPANAGALVNVLVYGTCGVRSPRAQTVYARFGIDDYAQIYVNGQAIENGRVYSTRGNPVYVALPLHEGWNTIMIKAAIMSGTWAYEIQFADPGNELEFAPCPKSK